MNFPSFEKSSWGKSCKQIQGPYKSALIAAPRFYCAQGAAIEEHRNRKMAQLRRFSIAAPQ